MVLCPYTRCQHSEDKHDFNAQTCKDLNTKLPPDSKDYYKYDEQPDPDLDTPEIGTAEGAAPCNPIEEKHRLIDGIQIFLREANKPELRVVYINDPFHFFQRLHDIFPPLRVCIGHALKHFRLTDPDFQSSYVDELLRNREPHEIMNIDWMLKSAAMSYIIAIKSCRKTFMNEVSRYHADIKSTALTLTESAKTFVEIQDSLRTSANQVAEVSSKLVAESKKLEIKQAEMAQTSEPKSKPSTSAHHKTIKAYPCSGLYLVVGDDGKLDPIQTMKANKTLSTIDAPLLNGLDAFGPKSLSRISQVPWNVIVRANPADPEMSPRERGEILFSKIMENRKHIDTVSPQVFSVIM